MKNQSAEPDVYAAKFSANGENNMAGRIKTMIDSIIEQRAKGNTMLQGVLRTKLMLKGIDPKRYTAQSEDDPAIISKLEALVKELR
jgi:hypothetical protein